MYESFKGTMVCCYICVYRLYLDCYFMCYFMARNYLSIIDAVDSVGCIIIIAVSSIVFFGLLILNKIKILIKKVDELLNKK